MSDGQIEPRFLIHVTVDGRDCGTWDTWSGGDKDTNSTKYRSGGSPDEESLGGGVTYSDLTITRNYRLSRDGASEPFLLGKVSLGQVVAVKQPLDPTYKATGTALKALGKLKTYQSSGADSNGNNAAMVGIVIEPSSITGA